MHFDNSIDPKSGDDKKPEIITMYNATKSGVDVVDKMCSTYSTSRKSRRWPMALFFRLVGIAGVNSQVIYTGNNPNTTLARRLFLREIGLSLIKPQICKRTSNMRVPKHLREKAARIANSDDVHSPETSAVEIKNTRKDKAARCSYCLRNKDIKTKTYCAKCMKTMCLKLMQNICESCLNNASDEELEN